MLLIICNYNFVTKCYVTLGELPQILILLRQMVNMIWSVYFVFA